jgi:hypothetical protein
MVSAYRNSLKLYKKLSQPVCFVQIIIGERLKQLKSRHAAESGAAVEIFLTKRRQSYIISEMPLLRNEGFIREETFLKA